MTVRGTAKLQVWLSRSETEEWEDAEFRAKALKEFRERARLRGRRHFEVFDAAGSPLHDGVV